ncbi:MAG: adenosylcobinamide-GDP ribazoletransferase [Actinomycetota bacterium]
MSGFFDAMALLTRVPTRGGAHTERAVPWLPVVGAVIGVVVAGMYASTRGAVGPTAAAALAVGAGILLTGALHEDGLADTADAFGAGVGRERTLEILKDPRHGTYGTLALVLSVVVRVAALSALTGLAAVTALPVAHSVSRAAAGWMLGRLPAATPDGLGATYAAPVTSLQAGVALGIGAIAAVGLLGVWGLGAVSLAVLAASGVGRLAASKIGGITGDVLGATQQLCEIGVLLLAAAAARAGGAVPWWQG